MTRYPLPSDTQAVLQRYPRKCQNPGLLFERYTPDLRGKEAKQQALEAICRCKPNHRALDAYRHRLRVLVESADAITFQAKTDWRFVTGLGRNTPFEVGFTFHRLYGFPVIPGSSLKGLARAWAHFRIKEEKPESDPEEDPLFAVVFGQAPKGDESEGGVGGAVFFEAVPLDDPALELDVMTPHFPDYYSGQRPPTDDQNPVPIPFLTVKPGVRFGFAVGWRGALHPEAHNQAVEWLKAGLKNLGAGGKTAAGYGYFEVMESQ
ncbi:MAG: type III-B CRISPR module RAMP protein Cmr6 [Anaerolineae bacterium]